MGDITIVTDLLRRSAEKYPDRNAVSMEGRAFTYKVLLEKAVHISKVISSKIDKGTYIPVYMEKSPETLAIFYGIVMAGCTYIPISGEQPRERAEKILNVLDTDIVIADASGAEVLSDRNKEEIITVDSLFAENTDGIDTSRANTRENQLSGDDSLYVIFTSGSTGNPKGVEISHKSVIDFIGHFVETFGFTCEDRFGNQAPFDFDVSVKDIYSAVSVGAEVVLIPKEYFAIPPRLIDYICDSKVTILIWAVPALCIISGMKGLEYRVPVDLRKVMFSGQAMPVKQLIRWQEALPETEFVNLYGPTEITCNCTYYRINKKFEPDDRLPMGEVFAGREIKLVDSREGSDAANESADENRPMELYVMGESLAKGYYNNPEETAKRFVMLDGKRAYKTGDMVEKAADGQLYFAGRSDFQIKHMGHRIELEEVEASIGGSKGVESVICTYNKEKGRMTCYYTGDIDSKELRTILKDKLPMYMIPNKFKQLEALPMLKNGKIDRQALIRLG